MYDETPLTRALLPQVASVFTPPLSEDELRFARGVINHDYTYDFTDDPVVWDAGRKEHRALRSFAEQLPRAALIWNRVIDLRVPGETASHFYFGR